MKASGISKARLLYLEGAAALLPRGVELEGGVLDVAVCVAL